jgi:hypothetical protein
MIAAGSPIDGNSNNVITHCRPKRAARSRPRKDQRMHSSDASPRLVRAQALGSRTFSPLDWARSEDDYKANASASIRQALIACETEGRGIVTLPAVGDAYLDYGIALAIPSNTTVYGRGPQSRLLAPGLQTEAQHWRFFSLGSPSTASPGVDRAFRNPGVGGSGLAVNATFANGRLTAATIAAAGNGYIADPAGDVCTLVGGDGTPAQVTVTAVASHRGPVTAIAVSDPGTYTVTPDAAGPIATTSRHGALEYDHVFDWSSLVTNAAIHDVWLDGGCPYGPDVEMETDYHCQQRGIDFVWGEDVAIIGCNVQNVRNMAMGLDYCLSGSIEGCYSFNVGRDHDAPSPKNNYDLVGIYSTQDAEAARRRRRLAIRNCVGKLADVGVMFVMCDADVIGCKSIAAAGLVLEAQQANYKVLDTCGAQNGYLPVPGRSLVEDFEGDGDRASYGYIDVSASAGNATMRYCSQLADLSQGNECDVTLRNVTLRNSWNIGALMFQHDAGRITFDGVTIERTLLRNGDTVYSGFKATQVEEVVIGPGGLTVRDVNGRPLDFQNIARMRCHGEILYQATPTQTLNYLEVIRIGGRGDLDVQQFRLRCSRHNRGLVTISAPSRHSLEFDIDAIVNEQPAFAAASQFIWMPKASGQSRAYVRVNRHVREAPPPAGNIENQMATLVTDVIGTVLDAQGENRAPATLANSGNPQFGTIVGRRLMEPFYAASFHCDFVGGLFRAATTNVPAAAAVVPIATLIPTLPAPVAGQGVVTSGTTTYPVASAYAGAFGTAGRNGLTILARVKFTAMPGEIMRAFVDAHNYLRVADTGPTTVIGGVRSVSSFNANHIVPGHFVGVGAVFMDGVMEFYIDGQKVFLATTSMPAGLLDPTGFQIGGQAMVVSSCMVVPNAIHPKAMCRVIDTMP